MSKYLALSDLDDTLLTGDKKITEETKEFLHEFVKRGNIFSFCTGRSYLGTKKFYDRLDLNIPMVTDNGCAIYNLDGKTKLFEIPLDVFKEFLDKVYDFLSHMYTITGHGYAYSKNLSFVPDWVIHNEDGSLHIEESKALDMKYPPLISNLWVYEDKIDEIKSILEEYKDEIFYRNWGLYYNEEVDMNLYSIEIHSSHASKGQALRYLKEYYKIDEDKTMSFGDQLNDISMIEEAHYGVAMINAVGELKSYTKYVTDYDFNNNGVIEFIKKHNLY